MWQSKGGEGLEKARAKSRKKKMKEMAKAENAYTIKVPLPYNNMADPSRVVGYINSWAARGYFVAHNDRRGDAKMVRAFVTDTGEVWARVIPKDEK